MSIRIASVTPAATRPCRISIEQQSHWFLEQMDPGNPANHLPYRYVLTGALNVPALELSLNRIVARHQALRTYFPVVEGEPSPAVYPYEPIRLTITKLTKEEELRFEREFVAAPFDLSRDRLYRFALLKRANDEHVLIAVFHHIVFDGWSKPIFRGELLRGYAYFAAGEGELPGELPIQYETYVDRQTSLLSSERYANDMAYWLRKLDGEIPELNLICDFARTDRYSLGGDAHVVWIGEPLAERLKRFGRKEKATTFMLFLTALYVLLHRYTGQEDLLIGCPSSGRGSPELETLLGVFVNTFALRTTVTGDMTATETLRAVRSTVFEAIRHQSVPFTKLVSELERKRALHGRPLFRVMLNVLNMASWSDTAAGLSVEEEEGDNAAAVTDLSLKVTECQGKLKCAFIYRGDLFKRETIERLSGHFLALLEGIAEQSDVPIARLGMLGPEERRELLYEWNRSRPTYPTDRSAHELFEQQSRLRPNEVALIHRNERLTYAALEERANRLAHYLREAGVGPGQTVAVLLDRSMDLIVSYLAVWKAGGAYVPIDVSIPTDRIAYMLSDSRASIAITVKRESEKLPAAGVGIVFLDAEAELIRAMPGTSPDNRSRADRLAYVMYTSGSTGMPKGVAVPHRGIVRLVRNDALPRLDENHTIAQTTSISFDPSVLEIYGALLNGGKLLIAGGGQSSLADIGEEIRSHGATVLCTVPEMFNQLLEVCGEHLASLRYVYCGGDMLPAWLARKCAAKLPECRLFNAYGPTENSVATTFYPVGETDEGTSVPIGTPLAGDRVYILDSYLEPVPVGVAGELYVTGDGLACGYYGNDRLTAEKFVPNPFASEAGEMLYATGDLVRYRPDRNIEFLGRKDFQVKIRGCRIELGEVEAVADRHPSVRKSAAKAWKNEIGAYQLVLYVVMETGESFRQDRIRRYMQEKLPSYMVPAFIVEMEAFPMTPFGKIDRKSLPDPDAAPCEERFVLPRTEAEGRLYDIWAELLGHRAFGTTEGFFRLGGHSLLALRLFADIERSFRKKLPVSLIYREDTIEKLAARLTAEGDGSADGSLVEIQPHGRQLPLYCVHDVNGEVLSYRHLAAELGADRPIYGLRDTRDLGEKTSIRGYASKYVNEILRRQPAGPYQLIGYSLGGFIAYEMAQLLIELGQEIALLAIVDTRNPRHAKPPAGLLGKLRANARTFASLSLRSKFSYAGTKLRSLLVKLGVWSVDPKEAEERRRHAYLLAAIAEYEPKPYPRRMILFQTDKKDGRGHGWETTDTGIVEAYRVPGDHATVLDEPNAGSIAREMKRYLLAGPSRD